MPRPWMSYLFGDIPYKYEGQKPKKEGHPGSMTTIVYWGYIGIMEKKMETTIMGYIGIIIGYILASAEVCKTGLKAWSRQRRVRENLGPTANAPELPQFLRSI